MCKIKQNVILIMLLLCIIYLYIYNNEYIIKTKSRNCQPKNIDKRNIKKVWNAGNYIDLGANNGDSVEWFFNIKMAGVKYRVPYPKIPFNITKNFNTFIFEGNPLLCNKIYKVVDYIKQHTDLVIFNVYCPVIVSTYDGVDVMSVDIRGDISSSKYYSSNSKFNNRRRNFTVPVINFTNFVLKNIPANDFNVMKFDVEGEEHYIIPDLLKKNQLKKFDILYSEFHRGGINNPVKRNAIHIFKNFLNYTNSHGIDTYEEGGITKYHKKKYLNLHRELLLCRKGIYTK